MNIYEKLGKNIGYYIENLNKDDEFKEAYPQIDALEYASTQSDIKIKRLNNIISGKAKIRIYELYKIAVVLGVEISDIITEDIIKEDVKKT